MAYPQTSFLNTTFSAPSLISRRRKVVFENTLLYQLDVLKSTGRYDAFKLEWHSSYTDKPNTYPVPNHLFWDSDVAKWIEAACYFLSSCSYWPRENENINAEIDAAVRELVQMIAAAQQEDGYLNIHFTVVDPKGRFTHLRDMHELYNAGHLIEAALAHQAHYQNDLLLNPIIKYVDLLCRTFGPGPDQKHGYPGHPEIELALLRLFERTKDVRHWALAQYFIEERGNPKGQDGRHYYEVEAEARGEMEHERPAPWPAAKSFWYQQAHKPIVEQETIEGHSVRAMYLLTAVADLVRIGDAGSNDAKRTALERLWTNMVERKMYLTGGIGAIKQWEGFGVDYFLPSGTDEGGCYAETCAGIGVMMLAERMLQIDLDGKFADIMELCFYNTVLTGMSANGKQFTYVNQLASTDTDLSKRKEWFTCACCPPNVARLLGYIGGYLWSHEVDEKDNSAQVNVHMYSSATLKIAVGKGTVELEQKSNWPWEGKIEFSLKNASVVATTIKLRIPAWSADWKISPNLPHAAALHKGYLTLPPDWLKSNPNFELNIPLKARYVAPHPYTNQDVVALARGPLIYCVEDFDNPWVDDHFKSLLFDPSAGSGEVTETQISDPRLGEPCVALTAHNVASFLALENHSSGPDRSVGKLAPLDLESKSKGAVERLVFIPYCLRDNRGGNGHMRVGIRRKR